MKSGMTSTKDLNPLILKMLEDKVWHAGSEIMFKMDDSIMHERAYRFYQAMSKKRLESTPQDNRTYSEMVRHGKRRGVYLCLQHLVHGGWVKIKAMKAEDGKPLEFEAREFMLSDKTPKPPKAARPKRKATPSVTPESPAADLVLSKEYTEIVPVISAVAEDPLAPNRFRETFLSDLDMLRSYMSDHSLATGDDLLDHDDDVRRMRRRAMRVEWKGDKS